MGVILLPSLSLPLPRHSFPSPRHSEAKPKNPSLRPPVPLIFHRPIKAQKTRSRAKARLLAFCLRDKWCLKCCLVLTASAGGHPGAPDWPGPRRRKLRIPRFAAGGKARSLRCPSSPRATRFAGLARGPQSGGHAVPGGTTITPSQAVSYCISCSTPWGT